MAITGAKDLPMAILSGMARDWTSDRLASAGYKTPEGSIEPRLAARFVASKLQPKSGALVDWNIATGSPVRAAPAAYGAWTSSANTDLFAFAVTGTSATRGIGDAGQIDQAWPGDTPGRAAGIYVLTDLYQTKPDIAGYTTTASVAATKTFSDSHLFFNYNTTASNRKLYALSNQGDLYCFQVPVGGPRDAAVAPSLTACTGSWPYVAGRNVTQSAPWPVFNASGDVTDIYFGDDGGYLHRVNSSGTAVWTNAPLANPDGILAALAPPVVVDYVVYLGDARGRYFRVIDTAAGSRPNRDSGTSIASVDLCGGAPGSCTAAQWNIRTSPAFDFDVSKSYITSGGAVYEFPIGSSVTWQASTISKTLVSSPTVGIYSSPSLDRAQGWLYVAHNNSLYKVKYPFTGTSSSNVFSTALQRAVTGDATYPRSTPLTMARSGNTFVYVGSGAASDDAGRAERYGCSATVQAPALLGDTSRVTNYGARVRTPFVGDYNTGNVNFGYENEAGTAGGVVQFPTSTGGSGFDCPTNLNSTTSNKCAEDSNKCIAGCPATACPGTNVTGSACDAGTGICTGSCSAGFADCNNDLNTDGCEISTTSNVSNCGACGTVCSTNNITPTCTSSVCGGTCNTGYADCNADAGDGCEVLTSCNSGGCCGSTCTSSSDPITSQACVSGTCQGGNADFSLDTRPRVCGDVSEHQTATITCPAGTRIRRIEFASYGTPNGSCGGFSTSSCNSGTSSSVVSTACLGLTSCNVLAENSVFGDPCSGTFKRLKIQVRCGC